MYCAYCGKPAEDLHHIIPKSQGGSSNEINLIPLCRQDHYEIHHGIHTERKKEILEICYAQIRKDLSKCWTGKYPPKIVNLLENS